MIRWLPWQIGTPTKRVLMKVFWIGWQAVLNPLKRLTQGSAILDSSYLCTPYALRFATDLQTSTQPPAATAAPPVARPPCGSVGSRFAQSRFAYDDFIVVLLIGFGGV